MVLVDFFVKQAGVFYHSNVSFGTYQNPCLDSADTGLVYIPQQGLLGVAIRPILLSACSSTDESLSANSTPTPTHLHPTQD